jgi:hypothetical protein
MMRQGLLLLAVLGLARCGSLAPGAEAIKLTRDPKVVAGCTNLGAVSGMLDSRYVAGTKNRMVNQAFALGADTVFLTSTAVSAEGMAYRCAPASPK